MKRKCHVLMFMLICALALSACRAGRQPTTSTAPPATGGQATASVAAQNTPAPDSYKLVTPESTETAAPAVQSTAGAVPEAQPFLNYTSAKGGYDVQAPEAWEPEASGADVKFTHGYSGISVQIINTAEPFTLDVIKGVYVADLIRTGRAVDVKAVEMITTKGGPAVHVEYENNSEPVDGKKVRLSSHRYYYSNDGKLAALTMWAPAGAASGDVWQQVPDTFFWR